MDAEDYESKIRIKVTKKMIKYMKEVSKLAKLCDAHNIPFKFHIENKTSLKEDSEDVEN